MKYLTTILTLLVFTSCTSIMTSHRMKAAERKMLAVHDLYKNSQWDEALAMTERMRSSVTNSVSDKPRRVGAAATSVDLRPLLRAWDEGPRATLCDALRQHDASAARQALTTLRQQCMTCHLAIGKTEIVLSDFVSH